MKNISNKLSDPNNIITYTLEDEVFLKKIEKTFVLCIDPETWLPFMLNMGLGLADICDLDNRPKELK